MNYISTVPVDSKLLPGVSYVLKKMSAGRRAAFNLAMANYFGRQRDLWAEREPLETELLQIINEERATKRAARARDGAPLPEGDDPMADLKPDSSIDLRIQLCRATPSLLARFDDAKLRKITDLMMEELRLDQDEMQPALVRWGLQSISGLEIDGKPATADNLIDSGQTELFTEIATEISRVMRLSGIEAENLELPTTSGAQVGGLTNGIAAPTASLTASM